MTRHHTIDIATPPPLPPAPGYWPPPGPPPSGGPRRRWSVLATAAAAGAVVAAVIAAVITIQVRDTTPAAAPTPAPITKTVPSPAPVAPAPLPAAQADRQTCEQGWIPAGRFIDSGKAALATLPSGVKIGDPVVQTNPDWNATAQRAAGFYRQAGEALRSAIAPGTTPILSEAAATAVKELRLSGDAISTNDASIGNVGKVGNAAAKEVGVLCDRLAP